MLEPTRGGLRSPSHRPARPDRELARAALGCLAVGELAPPASRPTRRALDRREVEPASTPAACIRTTTQLDAVADADLVVEAVFESVESSARVFEALGKLCRDDACWPRPSAIPITQLAAATSRPESVVGTHFFSRCR